MWDLIVSVPGHCLSFYFTEQFNLVFHILYFSTALGRYLLQAFYRKLITGNLVQHGLPSPQDMSLTQDSN